MMSASLNDLCPGKVAWIFRCSAASPKKLQKQTAVVLLLVNSSLRHQTDARPPSWLTSE